jgi:outer membrane cobalamin receptor
MHAVVVRETGQNEAIEGSGTHLMANVVPRIREAPGAVSALWMTDGSGGTLNVLVFENEEAARAALEPVRNAPRPGFMKSDSVEVYRVLAHC